ncbi:MAG: MOSC domain-containing protein [Acidobacteriota bacterium]
MKVLSVAVGMPGIVQTQDEEIVTTAIFKSPMSGRVKVGQLNLEGDAQADLRVHGGPAKSVYIYPSEHYAYWQKEMPDHTFEPANFGENLTTQGLIETEAYIGDVLRIGTAEFAVTQPRMPCYKLGIRFGRKDIIRRFLQSRRSGIYLTVLKTGELGENDEITILERNEHQVTVDDIVRLYVEDKTDVETMRRAILIGALPDGWKQTFRERIDGLDG